jgi:hypothetical protein
MFWLIVNHLSCSGLILRAVETVFCRHNTSLGCVSFWCKRGTSSSPVLGTCEGYKNAKIECNYECGGTHVPFWSMKLPARFISSSVVVLLVCWSFEYFEELGSYTDICILVSYVYMVTYEILKNLNWGSLRSSPGLVKCEAWNVWWIGFWV